MGHIAAPATVVASTRFPAARRRHQRGVARWGAIAAAVALIASAAWWWHGRATGSAAHAEASASSASAGKGGWGQGGRTGSSRRGSGLQTVAVDRVVRKDIPVTVQTVGTFTAANTAVVRAQVSGVLQQLLVQEGQQVRAGQVIAQIDPRAFQAALAQAEGALARDQALLDNARIDLRRYQDLIAKDAVPRQQLETQQATVHQLEGTVKLDQAAVDTARLQLSYTRVSAPIAGRVGIKQVDVGNVVQTSDANGIVSITQTQPMALVMSVPAAYLGAMQQRLHAHQPLTVRATDRQTGKLLATGAVGVLDNAIDATTDTIKVKALFANKDDALFPNQAISAALDVDTVPATLAVPDAAITRGARGMQVFVVDEGYNINVRAVKPGASANGWTAITGDVQEGERVVIDGLDKLRDGAKVEVADGRGPAAGSAAAGSEHRRQLPPEIAEKIKAMSPDERRAWFQQHRREQP